MHTIIIRDEESGTESVVPLERDNNGGYILKAALLPSDITVYDPGLHQTAPTTSAICFTDGERCLLTYRGYRIEDLVENCSYLEVSYLLIYGELPGRVTLDHWHRAVMTHAFTHVKLNELMQSFNYDAHPMGMFIS